MGQQIGQGFVCRVQLGIRVERLAVGVDGRIDLFQRPGSETSELEVHLGDSLGTLALRTLRKPRERFCRAGPVAEGAQNARARQGGFDVAALQRLHVCLRGFARLDSSPAAAESAASSGRCEPAR